MSYIQGVYNEDGEPLGTEVIYDDPPDIDEYYDDEYWYGYPGPDDGEDEE